jgi:hypothetical protein
MKTKRKLPTEIVFEEERLTEWFRKGRIARKVSKLQQHCRHGFELVEVTNMGYLQICCKCFRTLFVGD